MILSTINRLTLKMKETMKKILLLLALVMTVGAVNAGNIKQYAKFTAVSGNANITWDGSSNTVTIKGTNANTYQIFSFSAGTLTKYKTIHLNVSEKNGIAQVMFNNGGSWIYWEIASTGSTSKTLSEISGLTPAIIAACTEIRITGQRSGAFASNYTYTIDPNSVYLETEDVECMSIKSTLNSSSTHTTPLVWTNRNALDNQLGTELNSNSNVLSYTAGSLIKSNGYINLTGYDRAVVNFNDGAIATTLRMIYSDGTDDGNTVIETKVTNTATQMFETLYNTDFISLKANTSKLTVNTIDFIKDFDAASTTAFNIVASSSSTVNYDRTFTTDKKATVCLPFDLTAAQVTATGGKFYEFIGATASTLQFQDVSSTTAYTPYIFVAGSNTTPFASLSNIAVKASAGATTTVEHNGFTFNGTLAKTDVASGSYGISNDSFVKAGTGVTIKAFRAYFTGSFSSAPSFLNIDFIDGGMGGTTGINEVKSTNAANDGVMYNLQGQRVNGGHKGLVIKNGKKVMMK